jgi:hypothetical protein
MTIRARQLAIAGAAALGSTGFLAPQAIAAPSKVTGGRTALTLTAGGKKVLKKKHVKLAARKPGSTSGRTYRLPVKSGSKFDFGNNRGTLTQRGSLRFKHGRRTAVISGLKITLGKNGKVVAKVGGKKMTLAVLSRSKQRVRSSRANRSVGNIRFRLTKKAAKRINRKLRVKAVGARKPIGSLGVRVHKPATGAPGTGPATDAPTTGAAKIGFGPGVSSQLEDAGLQPSALPGADQLPDGTLNLPVAGATIDPQTGTGTVDLSGGIQLGEGDHAVTIDNPQIVINADSQGALYANVNGVRVKLAELEGSGLNELLQQGATELSNLLVTLSPEGAAALNEAGGISLFVPGTPFGDISLTLPSS